MNNHSQQTLALIIAKFRYTDAACFTVFQLVRFSPLTCCSNIVGFSNCVLFVDINQRLIICTLKFRFSNGKIIFHFGIIFCQRLLK
ncbi:UPF0102 protein [Trichinella spiralis]|uniref:UPF0102 protein n=1 Tax=Trichinella spiralis TaxID=6334 RepID=A0ABR3KI09_TRISP